MYTGPDKFYIFSIGDIAAPAAMSLYPAYSMRKQSQCSSLCYLIYSAREEGNTSLVLSFTKNKVLDKKEIKCVNTTYPRS